MRVVSTKESWDELYSVVCGRGSGCYKARGWPCSGSGTPRNDVLDELMNGPSGGLNISWRFCDGNEVQEGGECWYLLADYPCANEFGVSRGIGGWIRPPGVSRLSRLIAWSLVSPLFVSTRSG